MASGDDDDVRLEEWKRANPGRWQLMVDFGFTALAEELFKTGYEKGFEDCYDAYCGSGD
jgi:hypothetical protein